MVEIDYVNVEDAEIIEDIKPKEELPKIKYYTWFINGSPFRFALDDYGYDSERVRHFEDMSSLVKDELSLQEL